LLAALVAAAALLPPAARVAAPPEKIVIDGDVSDWDALGIQPAHTDELGDTEPWSRDPAIVGVGATAEPADMVELNDKARDLKAVYFYADQDWIYIRLDVNELYPEWCLASMKPPCPYPYPNVSIYHIYFHVEGLTAPTQSGFSGAAEGSFGNYAWHFLITMDFGCSGGTYGAPYLQWPDWSGISVTPENNVGEYAVDLAHSSFEIKVNRSLIENRIGGSLGKVHVFIASFKPGEPQGLWGVWPHVFDPDDPGGPGEGVGGPDHADYMPNGAFDVSTMTVVGPLIEVDLSAAPPAAPAPPEEVAAGPPVALIAAVAVIVVVVAVVAILLLRRRRAGGP